MNMDTDQPKASGGNEKLSLYPILYLAWTPRNVKLKAEHGSQHFVGNDPINSIDLGCTDG